MARVCPGFGLPGTDEAGRTIGVTMVTTDEQARALLERAEETDGYDRAGIPVTRWTITEGAVSAWVELRYDEDCPSPVDPDWADGVPVLAMIALGWPGPRYIGTGPDIRDIGEYDSPTEYLIGEGIARAALEIDYGSYGEQRAVLYVPTEDDGWTDPAAALATFAQELRRWETGERYGWISSSGDSCWGFVGDDYARAEAGRALADALDAARTERAERAYWSERDVVTVGEEADRLSRNVRSRADVVPGWSGESSPHGSAQIVARACREARERGCQVIEAQD